MKIMLDTNVLISALVFGGKAEILLKELLLSHHKIYVSDYVDKEFCEKLHQKWPAKANTAYKIFHSLDINFCKSTSDSYGISLRDKKDIPILNDAIAYEIDVLLTGDKDFLEADIKSPIIMDPSTFLDFLHYKNSN